MSTRTDANYHQIYIQVPGWVQNHCSFFTTSFFPFDSLVYVMILGDAANLLI